MLGILGGNKGHKIKGSLVIMRKNVLDINSLTSVKGVVGTGINIIGGVVDTVTAFASHISIQLISATKADGNNHFFELGNCFVLKSLNLFYYYFMS